MLRRCERRFGPLALATREHWRLHVTLTRHFLRRFATIESIAPGVAPTEAVTSILCLLALPGYILAYAAFSGAAQMRSDPLHLYSARWLMLVWSFVVVGLLAAFQWEAFLIDSRDRLNLGPLPVRQGAVFLAKLSSLLGAVLVFHVSVNLMSGLVFPIAFPRVLRTAAVHQGVLLAQTLFVAFAVASLQGAVALCLPSRLARRASRAVQSMLLVMFASLLALQGPLGGWVRGTRSIGHPLSVLFPPAWFMALYDELLGAGAPPTRGLARLALVATLGACLLAVALCLYSLHAGEAPLSGAREGARPWQAWTWPLDRAFEWSLVRSSRERALYHFTRVALARGGRSLLILGAWIAVGVALSLAALIPELARLGGSRLAISPALLAPLVILPLSGVLGLRLSAAFPVTLEANRIFRVAEPPSDREHVRAVRAAVLRVVLAPLLLLLVPPYLALWGPATTVAHVTFSLLVALTTEELLFLRFAKIPFTCSYVPGRARLKHRWPLYLAVGLFFCGVVPEAEATLLRRPLAFAAALVGLVAAVWGLARWRERGTCPSRRLVFDEAPPPPVIQLHLSS